MWQATPDPSRVTFTSRASASQSAQMEHTVKKLPELSPFSQNFWRLRLQNQTRPLSTVRRSDYRFM